MDEYQLSNFEEDIAFSDIGLFLGRTVNIWNIH